jgi:hypothetical protein
MLYSPFMTTSCQRHQAQSKKVVSILNRHVTLTQQEFSCHYCFYQLKAETKSTTSRIVTLNYPANWTVQGGWLSNTPTQASVLTPAYEDSNSQGSTLDTKVRGVDSRMIMHLYITNNLTSLPLMTSACLRRLQFPRVNP